MIQQKPVNMKPHYKNVRMRAEFSLKILRLEKEVCFTKK